MSMTKIDSTTKKEDRGHLLLEQDQNRPNVVLPPKKLMANKVHAAERAASNSKRLFSSSSSNVTNTTSKTTTDSEAVTNSTTTSNLKLKAVSTQNEDSSRRNGTHGKYFGSLQNLPSVSGNNAAKRRPSTTIESSRDKKVSTAITSTASNSNISSPNTSRSATPVKAVKTITHSEKIVQAEITNYRPYFTEPDGDSDSTISEEEKNLLVELEYPGPVEPERFFLLKPVLKSSSGRHADQEEEDKDEYNPINDLMRTVEFIYDCYLTPEQQKKLGDQSHGIMRNLTKYRNRRNGAGFAQAVKDFNRVIKQFKQEGILSKNASDMCHPTYDLACHILFQVYSRTVAPQADALNNYAAFSNNVYGEINPILVKEFIAKTGINSRSVFMDMGCGIGNVVLQVAAQTGCEAYGIEIMETPCRMAKRQLREYARRMKAWKLPTGKIHFRHGDFLDVAANDLYSTLKRSDVLLVNNYAFDATVNQALAQLFLDLKEGTKIISLKSFVPKHHKINQRTLNMPESILRVEKYEYFSEAVSWTNNGGNYYIATVDRSRLAPYFEEMYGR